MVVIVMSVTVGVAWTVVRDERDERDARARGGLALVVLARREPDRAHRVWSRRPAAHRVVCGAATLTAAGPSRRPASTTSSGLTST